MGSKDKKPGKPDKPPRLPHKPPKDILREGHAKAEKRDKKPRK